MKSDRQDKKNKKATRVGRPKVILGEKRELLKKLYFVEGFSIRQTARILGVSKSSVWRTANEIMEKMEVAL